MCQQGEGERQYLLAQERHEREARAYALRRAVAIEATKQVYGYCGGLAEKADHHVDQIIPALCRVVGITEDDLVAIRNKNNPVN